MAQVIKTFNIGEYALGGRIRVELRGKYLSIQARDWDTGDIIKSGSTTLPDIAEMPYDNGNCKRAVREFIQKLTSDYYVEQIMEYIASHLSRRTPEQQQFADNWTKLF